MHNDKDLSTWQTFRRLWPTIAPFKSGLIVAGIALVLNAASDTFMLSLLKPLLDDGFGKTDRSVLVWMPLVVIGLMILRGITSYVSSYCISWVSGKVVMTMRRRLFGHMMGMPVSFFDKQSTGTLLSRITYDSEQVASSSSGALITVVREGASIIGLFIMGSAMLNSVIGTVEDQVVINAFISDDADQADVQAFEAELKTWSNVKSVTYKDKDDALAEYTSKMSGNADATMSALDGQNPLPASFAIEMDDPSKVESTAKKLKKDADFQKIADDGDVNASVLYGQEEVSRLFQVTNYIRIAAVVLVGLLTFIAFIFINNTIRLSITARRREIAIMRLVGASNGFIRGPFITEGVLQAILGSLLSIGVLELLRNLMIPRLQESIGWMSFALPMQYYLVTYAALILVGVIIGLFGSAIAMRRYLRV